MVLATGEAVFPTKSDCPPPVPCPECPLCPECPEVKKEIQKEKFTERPSETKPNLVYRPSVPSIFSIEIHWKDVKNNVDLYVCKNNNCVFGNKRKVNSIGAWSSGKEVNTLGQFFKKTNFRTTMEAVRQVDELIPGTYSIQAVFKQSDVGESNIEVTCLVYSKRQNDPQVETTTKFLSLNPGQKIQIATVDVLPDGNFILKSY